jgi:molecular chaperone HscB
MQRETRGIPLQQCRNCGTGAPVDDHFCPSCEKILTLWRHGDYFRFMGVPRRMQLEKEELDRRFRSLSRSFHPDYFCNGSPAERLASLERASYLNDAYRTLRNPVSRMEYLLAQEGLSLADAPRTGLVPPSLLEDVFEFNEELDEIRESGGREPADTLRRLEGLKRLVEGRLAGYDERLEALGRQWDEQAERGADDDARKTTLSAVRQCLLERGYIVNLVATVSREYVTGQTGATTAGQ